MQPNHVELNLPSVLGYEKIARGAVEAIAEQMNFSRERIEDLKTAVSEACLNAIEHGNNLEHMALVKVQMTVDQAKLEICIADMGRHEIPATLPSPGSGDIRGWGLFLIKQLMDEVEISQLPTGGNQIRMAIYIQPSKAVMHAASHAIQAVARRPRAIQPAADLPRAIQLAEDLPRAIQPAEDTPRAIQPAHDPLRAIQLAVSQTES